MTRAVLAVMDSVGIGGAPDAHLFGGDVSDKGANTLNHIAQMYPLNMPNMAKMGLGEAAKMASGLMSVPDGLEAEPPFTAAYGCAKQISNAKDTVSGHWEITGVPVTEKWHTFPKTIPAFPTKMMDEIVRQAGLNGMLGMKHASGTEIIKEFGEEHIKTGKPIFYTSADSVVQIAAHTKIFKLKKLYEVCEITKGITQTIGVQRVIARPFNGDDSDSFVRTNDRKDYPVPPPKKTLLDYVKGKVFAVGKINDIFDGKGVDVVRKASGNKQIMEETVRAINDAKDNDLVFSNFVDFDQLYGHRRDAKGYAQCLMEFDKDIPKLVNALMPGDMLVITADHGNDPTWNGTDHTREQVPVIITGPELPVGQLKGKHTFADIGATVANHLKTNYSECGKSML